jgi:micrococcal nuclease
VPEAPPLRSAPPDVDTVAVPADAQEAVVVRVTDGDTVVLRGRGAGPLPGEPTKVRVLLVDTPEVADGGECFGQEAADRTEELVPVGARVRVEADRDAEDRFGRALLHVYTEGGDNLGEVLLAEGYATVLQIDPNRLHLAAFEAREAEAREAGRGLWSACE